jgi:hypothetical protein
MIGHLIIVKGYTTYFPLFRTGFAGLLCSSNMKPMRHLISTLAPPLLILLFIYAAASKLLAFADFRGQLYNQAFPHWLADILLYTLPAAELVLAGLLCFAGTRRAGLWLAAGLLALFSGYIALALLHYWDTLPCSCGGIISRLSWGGHLALNLFFILISLSALLFQPNPQGKAENLRTE